MAAFAYTASRAARPRATSSNAARSSVCGIPPDRSNRSAASRKSRTTGAPACTDAPAPRMKTVSLMRMPQSSAANAGHDAIELRDRGLGLRRHYASSDPQHGLIDRNRNLVAGVLSLERQRHDRELPLRK